MKIYQSCCGSVAGSENKRCCASQRLGTCDDEDEPETEDEEPEDDDLCSSDDG